MDGIHLLASPSWIRKIEFIQSIEPWGSFGLDECRGPCGSLQCQGILGIGLEGIDDALSVFGVLALGEEQDVECVPFGVTEIREVFPKLGGGDAASQLPDL